MCEIWQSIHRRMAKKIKSGARLDAASFMIGDVGNQNLGHPRERTKLS